MSHPELSYSAIGVPRVEVSSDEDEEVREEGTAERWDGRQRRD
jgi:hypothetical protein